MTTFNLTYKIYLYSYIKNISSLFNNNWRSENIFGRTKLSIQTYIFIHFLYSTSFQVQLYKCNLFIYEDYSLFFKIVKVLVKRNFYVPETDSIILQPVLLAHNKFLSSTTKFYDILNLLISSNVNYKEY